MGGSNSKAVDEETAVVICDDQKGGKDLSSPDALQLPPQPSADFIPKAVGLENYGNTCYCNSVIQLLYSCDALRSRLLALHTSFEETKNLDETVLTRFAELCNTIHKWKKKKKDPVGPQSFVQKVKKENMMFRNALQQDAHEFAMFVMNCLIEGERQFLRLPTDEKTPIQQMFEGTFASETSCIDCETKTVVKEPFIDMSVDIEQSASLTRCIENFSAPEFLVGADKFRCDACCAPSPARKCLKLHCAPKDAMIIHLKRFKYVEERQAFKKLSWHVALPNELAVHTSCDGAVSVFALKGFVLHQGSGPNLGHYVTCIRGKGNVWRKFDDDLVTELTERTVQQYFGIPFHTENVSTSTAYILLYERV